VSVPVERESESPALDSDASASGFAAPETRDAEHCVRAASVSCKSLSESDSVVASSRL